MALHVPLCFAVHSQVSRVIDRGRERGGRGEGWWPLLVDAWLYSACILLPLTLSLTVAADALWLLGLVECAVIVAASATASAPSSSSPPPPAAAAPPPPPPAAVATAESLPSSTVFLSLYRVSLLLSTAVAILAVDFAVFPRRLAKTEEFGVSPVTPRRTHSHAPPTHRGAGALTRWRVSACGAVCGPGVWRADGQRGGRLHLLRCPHLPARSQRSALLHLLSAPLITPHPMTSQWTLTVD